MNKKFKLLYGIFAVLILSITTIGTTYAYWTATTSSSSNAIHTESTIYSISMDILPLYHDFSIIPMNDTDALKALKNQCKDKYDRGACSAYSIDVYGYNENLDYISGYMDIETNNMKNLSYMMLRLSDVFDESTCVSVDEEFYCVVKEATAMEEGLGLSLGDSYDVTGMTSTKFILLIWLSNLMSNQNDTDIGSFNATITMQAGNGGKIQGSISSAIRIGDNSEGV